MSRDACEVLRKGDYTTSEYDDLVQECVGETAEQEKTWIPLCREYPNLKGLTCEEVDRYRVEKSIFLEDCSQLYEDYSRYLRDEVMPLSMDEITEKYKDSPFLRTDWDKWNAGDKDAKLTVEDEIKHLNQQYPEFELREDSSESQKEYKENQLKALLAHFLDPEIKEYQARSKMISERHNGAMCPIGQARSGGHPFIASDESLNYESELMRERVQDLNVRDYFSKVKVFDRDDIYKMCKQLGQDLHNGYDLEFETYKDWKRNNYEDLSGMSTSEIRNSMENDKQWARFKEYENYNYKRQKTAERLGIKDYFTDKNTIFITTPRGGHELMSIFAYANGLTKSMVPSDIIYDDDGEVRGATWLGDTSGDVRTVITLDDIVESGDQLRRTTRRISDTIGNNRDIEIINMALCGRRNVNEVYSDILVNKKTGKALDRYEVRKKYDLTDKEIDEEGEWRSPFDHAIYGHEIYDLDDWREAVDSWSPHAVPTCAFPWHISDSSASIYLRGIYGSRDIAKREGRRSDRA